MNEVPKPLFNAVLDPQEDVTHLCLSEVQTFKHSEQVVLDDRLPPGSQNEAESRFWLCY